MQKITVHLCESVVGLLIYQVKKMTVPLCKSVVGLLIYQVKNDCTFMRVGGWFIFAL